MHSKLLSGQTIGVMSPSSSIVRERFDAGCAVLQSRGFHLSIHPQTYVGENSGGQFAGTAEQKSVAFMDLWADPKVDAIMASCGGNFSAQFLYLLDFRKLSSSPKPVIGFSDTTALLSALYGHGCGGGIFGPTVQTLGRVAHIDRVFQILSGQPDLTFELGDAVTVKDGVTESSPVFAATLSVLLSLAGTPYFPNLAGHILVIEDIGEELSHLDRALWQLYQIIPFPLLSGLVFGEFTDMRDTGRPLGFDLNGVIDKYTRHLDIPVVKNAPVGHGVNFLPIPLGRNAILDATKRCLILL